MHKKVTIVTKCERLIGKKELEKIFELLGIPKEANAVLNSSITTLSGPMWRSQVNLESSEQLQLSLEYSIVETLQ